MRISMSDAKENESESIVNQSKIIDSFLERHPEIEVVSERIDDGFSGVFFERPAFVEMMKDIEAGRVNCVVTKDLSRFGRESIETLRYLRRVFPNIGVRFIAINDNIDTLKDNPDDLIVSFKSLLNDSYSHDISIKTRSTLRTKRASGDYVGACPIYGYKKAEGNHNQLAVDDYPASIIQEIFNMRVSGYSAARIADTLNERGVLSPLEYKKDKGLPHPTGGYADIEGAKWSATTIIRILTDETYTGALVQGKESTPNYKLKTLMKKPEDEWYKTENAHEAIITEEIFNLVKRIMRLDTRTAPNSDKIYVFSGLLICGCCGGRMTRKTVPYKDKKYFYYYCSTGKKNGCTDAVSIEENELIALVRKRIIKHIMTDISPEALKIAFSLSHAPYSQEHLAELSDLITQNEHNLKKVYNYKSGLYANYINGNLSKPEYNEYTRSYTRKAEFIETSILRLKSKLDSIRQAEEDHEQTKSLCVKSLLETETLDRKLVISLVHSIKITGKSKIDIAFA